MDTKDTSQVKVLCQGEAMSSTDLKTLLIAVVPIETN